MTKNGLFLFKSAPWIHDGSDCLRHDTWTAARFMQSKSFKWMILNSQWQVEVKKDKEFT